MLESVVLSGVQCCVVFSRLQADSDTKQDDLEATVQELRFKNTAG
jgi:hypothetical protein